MKYVPFVAAAVLFLGIFDLPIGYYTFVKIVVFIVAIITLASEYKANDDSINGWVIALGLLAILFNPILPIYLHEKGAWAVIDALSAVFFIVEGFRVVKRLNA